MGRPYAEVIGDPIAHSKSPLIHRFWLNTLGLDADYRPLQVTAEDLPRYLETRRSDPDWRGCNVTMPHKQQVAALVGPSADRHMGNDRSANCIFRGETGLVARSFDVDALERTLPRGDQQDLVVVIGSGGAAVAACEALRQMGRRAALIGRNRDKSTALRAAFPTTVVAIGDFAGGDALLEGAAGLINATPLGMRNFPDMNPVILSALGRLGSGAFVYDMVYDPVDTQLLEQARRLGVTAIGGLNMLVEQAALSFARFFRVDPPRGHDGMLLKRLAS